MGRQVKNPNAACMGPPEDMYPTMPLKLLKHTSLLNHALSEVLKMSSCNYRYITGSAVKQDKT
jgi:hypothetical protein